MLVLSLVVEEKLFQLVKLIFGASDIGVLRRVIWSEMLDTQKILYGPNYIVTAGKKLCWNLF